MTLIDTSRKRMNEYTRIWIQPNKWTIRGGFPDLFDNIVSHVLLFLSSEPKPAVKPLGACPKGLGEYNLGFR